MKRWSIVVLLIVAVAAVAVVALGAREHGVGSLLGSHSADARRGGLAPASHAAGGAAHARDRQRHRAARA